MDLSRLVQFFEDETGAFSSTRLIFILWNFAVIGMLGYQLFVLKQTPKVEPSIVGILGTVMVGKVAQSFSENKSS